MSSVRIGEQIVGGGGVDGALRPDGELVEIGAGLDSLTDGVRHGDATPFQNAKGHIGPFRDPPFFAPFFAYLLREGVSPEIL